MGEIVCYVQVGDVPIARWGCGVPEGCGNLYGCTRDTP
jgi:hypothetical protein